MSGLNIPLRPSRRLAWFIVVAHALAAIAPWFSALSWWFCLLLDMLVGWSLIWNLRRHYWVGYRHLQYLERRWWLTDASGEHAVELAGEFLVTPWLLVLRFTRDTGAGVDLVLPPDSADADDLRRLRVLLRFALRGY